MGDIDGTVVATAGEMWPGSAVLDPSDDPGTGPVRARYALLPQGRPPRMLVPLDSAAARAASVRRLHTAAGGGCSVTGLLEAAMVRIAPALLMRQQIVVRGGAGGLDERLSEMLGTTVTSTIDLGTERGARGPVLQVFDRRGRTLAFVKIGSDPETSRAIRAEAQALATLAGHRFGVLRVPRVLGSGSWQEWAILALEPLPVPAWRAPTPWDPPEAAMEELGAAFSAPDAPLDQSPWWHRQWRAIASFDPVVRGRLGRCLERTELLADQQLVAWGAWHGDWTPWSMARRHRRVMVWNWASFETGAPRGLDHLHFVASVARARHGEDPDALLIALRDAARGTTEEGSKAHVRALLYLAAMATRDTSLLRGDGIDQLTPRTESIVVALEKLSGEVTEAV